MPCPRSAAHIQTQEGVRVDEVYTFGLPRVGDSAFSEWFNQQLPQAVHVTHYDDVRCRVARLNAFAGAASRDRHHV